MRKTRPMSIGELWNDFIESRPGRARRLTAARIPDIWPSIVGDKAAAHTESVEVVNGLLFVKMRSAAARNEMFMRRSEIKNTIDRLLGPKIVNDVIVK
jgi:hypothetical protein